MIVFAKSQYLYGNDWISSQRTIALANFSNFISILFWFVRIEWNSWNIVVTTISEPQLSIKNFDSSVSNSWSFDLKKIYAKWWCFIMISESGLSKIFSNTLWFWSMILVKGSAYIILGDTPFSSSTRLRSCNATDNEVKVFPVPVGTFNENIFLFLKSTWDIILSASLKICARMIFIRVCGGSKFDLI